MAIPLINYNSHLPHSGEAYYGLGQHQQGIMNYWGQIAVNPEQYNTSRSSYSFNIQPWHPVDNYSITQYMIAVICSLYRHCPYAADGSTGWLPATY